MRQLTIFNLATVLPKCHARRGQWCNQSNVDTEERELELGSVYYLPDLPCNLLSCCQREPFGRRVVGFISHQMRCRMYCSRMDSRFLLCWRLDECHCSLAVDPRRHLWFLAGSGIDVWVMSETRISISSQSLLKDWTVPEGCTFVPR